MVLPTTVKFFSHPLTRVEFAKNSPLRVLIPYELVRAKFSNGDGVLKLLVHVGGWGAVKSKYKLERSVHVNPTLQKTGGLRFGTV